LIVSGAVGEGRETPIGWILARLRCEEELAAATEPFELARGGATFLVRVDRFDATVAAAEVSIVARDSEGQLELFGEIPVAPVVRGYRLPELALVPLPPAHRVRRLSYSALAL